MKYGTVIDDNGYKIAFIRVLIDSETGTETPLFSPQRGLAQGEKIVYDDWQLANGMTKAHWTGTEWKETATAEEIAAAEAERAAMSPYWTYANQKATHHTCINSGVFRYLDNPHKHAPTVTFMASAGACLIW